LSVQKASCLNCFAILAPLALQVSATPFATAREGSVSNKVTKFTRLMILKLSPYR
jgi:hypothetical protein